MVDLTTEDAAFLRLLVRRELAARLKKIDQLKQKFGSEVRDLEWQYAKVQHAGTVLEKLGGGKHETL